MILYDERSSDVKVGVNPTQESLDNSWYLGLGQYMATYIVRR